MNWLAWCPRGLGPALCGLAIAYGLLAWGAIAVSRQSGGVATLWFANAWAIAWLTIRAAGSWRATLAGLGVVAVANGAANLLSGDPWLRALAFIPPNLVDVGLGAWLLRGGRAAQLTQRGPATFLGVMLRGAFWPPLLGALAGALTLNLVTGAPWAEVWVPWFEGALIGAVVTLPLALSVLLLPAGALWRRLLALDHLGLQTLTIGVTLLATAWLPMPFVYIALPLLAAAALTDFLVLAAATFTATVVVGQALVWGLFVPPPISERWEELFLYLPLVITVLPVQLLAISVGGLRRSRAALEQSMAQLSRAHDGLAEFVRIASHDLREPLNTVAAYTGLVQADAGVSRDSARYLGLVQEGVSRMRSLLDDLLSFARLGRDQAEPEQWVALDEVLDQALAELHSRIVASGAEVRRSPLPVLPGRRSMLLLLMVNLLSNALKFVAPGRAPQVEIHAEADGDAAVLVVADQGIGIAEADIPRLFSLFTRLHLPKDYPGTGLGLALCRRVVEWHGGEIRITSVLGEGTQVRVRLPLRGPGTTAAAPRGVE